MKKILLFFAALAVAFSAMADTMTVDFESATTEYTGWTFSYLKSQASNSAVTPHGGSYYGSTDGKTACTMTTSAVIAAPTSIVFYVSKESTNTTTSNWKVQVSTNGTTWTDVRSASATSMTKGEWNTVSQDLSSYTNVYVRVAYAGTTAKRCIDDVTLTYSTEGGGSTVVTVPEPTFSLEAGIYLESKTVTISVPEGADGVQYTLDGSDPSDDDNNPELITDDAAINVSATTTIKAVSVTNDGDMSSVVTKTYTIYQTTGRGTEASPFTLADVRLLGDALKGSGSYWVTGVIAGVCAADGTDSTPEETSEDLVNTNILLSSAVDNLTNTVPVGLKSGSVARTDLNIVDNSYMVGATVAVYGTVEKYFGRPGMKNVSNYKVLAGGYAVLLDKNVILMGIDETKTLTATVKNVTGATVVWTSSNTGIATVSNGVISPVAQGEVTIKAAITVDGVEYYDECVVTIGAAAPTYVSITLNETNKTLVYGSSLSLTAVVNGENDPLQTVTWTSNKTSVATVTTAGVVKAVGVGEATITVASTVDPTVKAECQITVRAMTCAEVNVLSADASVLMGEFVVTYVNGSYIYVRDESGSALIYKSGDDLAVGDVVPAGLKGTISVYNNLVEVKPGSNYSTIIAGKTSGTAPAPEVMTATPVLADVNKYVVFKNVEMPADAEFEFGSVATITSVAPEVMFYNKWKLGYAFENAVKYDIVGAVSVYNDDIQVFFISATAAVELTPFQEALAAIEEGAAETVDFTAILVSVSGTNYVVKEETTAVEAAPMRRIAAEDAEPTITLINPSVLNSAGNEPTEAGTRVAITGTTDATGIINGTIKAVDEKGWATGVDNTEAQKVEKIFRNGQVVIIKNGVEYSVMGQKL